MTVIKIKKGLALPIQGTPRQVIAKDETKTVHQVALLGRDYPGMKPTMAVQEGDLVNLGQLLFTDKKSPGVKFTSPGCGQVEAIIRGAKRKFEAIIISLNGDNQEAFPNLNQNPDAGLTPEEIRVTLIDSGTWTAFRTRPYGKIPAVDTTPHSLFITAMDTQPLAANPELIIARREPDFKMGLKVLRQMAPTIYLCLAEGQNNPGHNLPGITSQEFYGPHPAGLPSTHIHYLDPAHSGKIIWQIDYQDAISIGHLFNTGNLLTERIISLAGPAVKNPRLIKTRLGASISELCQDEINTAAARLISGSVLSGHQALDSQDYLGRYHHQICGLYEDARRNFFSWLNPGLDRFSIKRLFLSGFMPAKKFNLPTATWGGHRAIFPLGTYEQVMPIDIVATALLKSLANGDTEKAQDLGCLELIEEDLALCSFVCPGKNNFGPMLRKVLDQIEASG